MYTAEGSRPIVLEELRGLNFIVSIPAAFSGTCTKECVPGVLQHLKTLKGAGIDQVIIVCSDPPDAIKAWVKAEGWENSGLTFATDFGSFQYREKIGMQSEEDGKMDLPQPKGNLLRRSYSLFKDGILLWQYIEPDTAKYTFNVEEMLNALK